jgi:hypothetical protein
LSFHSQLCLRVTILTATILTATIPTTTKLTATVLSATILTATILTATILTATILTEAPCLVSSELEWIRLYEAHIVSTLFAELLSGKEKNS